MATKTRVTKKDVAEHRAKQARDLSPKWDGHESWDENQFLRFFHVAMNYYRLEFNGRDLKPKVINWMSANGYTKDQIKAFKDTKDFRCNTTMGSIAANLLRGMPPVRADFNDGKNTAQWLIQEISTVIQNGKNDVEPEVIEEKNTMPVVSIQERVREATFGMTEEIEETIESFSVDPESFDPKAFKVLNLLRGKQVKAAHARIIKDFYQRQYDEYLEVQEGKCDQLKEAYSHLQEAKVNRKPRAKKSKPVEKIVEKLKFLKQDEKLKLVSIAPTDIVGAKELWIYNTKSRKLGKYIAGEFNDLGVKGTSITGFDEIKSVQKTLRKPEEQLKEFKNSGKVALRKFLDDIKAVDIKLNGRINEDTILLKTQ